MSDRRTDKVCRVVDVTSLLPASVAVVMRSIDQSVSLSVCTVRVLIFESLHVESSFEYVGAYSRYLAKFIFQGHLVKVKVTGETERYVRAS